MSKTLIPQFSIRAVLYAMVGFGLLFLLVRAGVNGHAWAFALSIGAASLLFLFLTHAFFFFLAYLFSLLQARRSPAAAGSPFASLGVGAKLNSPAQVVVDAATNKGLAVPPAAVTTNGAGSMPLQPSSAPASTSEDLGNP